MSMNTDISLDQNKESVGDRLYRLLQILEFGGNVQENILNQTISQFVNYNESIAVRRGESNGCDF